LDFYTMLKTSFPKIEWGAYWVLLQKQLKIFTFFDIIFSYLYINTIKIK
jgi:hypothetical protein